MPETEEQDDAIASHHWRINERERDPYQIDAGVPADAMTEAPNARRKEGAEK